jgi:hypothetical protein
MNRTLIATHCRRESVALGTIGGIVSTLQYRSYPEERSERELEMITPNIFKFSAENLLAWTSAYAIWEPISYYVFPAIFKAATTQEYYNRKVFNFGQVAFGDYIYSTILFLIAQYVITAGFGSGPITNWTEWSKRLLTFLGIQWAGDLSFYGIVKNIPREYSNRYIDFFQRYGKEVGVGAPIGDSLYGIVWFLIMQLITSQLSSWSQTLLITTFLFGTFIASF